VNPQLKINTVVKSIPLASLQPDPANANKHREHGLGMLEDVIRTDGVARGIACDEDGYVIAGNATLEAAINAGLVRAIPITVTGNELVVSVLRGVKIDSPRGRRLALADNSIAAANIDMDAELVRAQAEEHGIDLDKIALSDAELAKLCRDSVVVEDASEPPDPTKPVRYTVVVTCNGPDDRAAVLERLKGMGLKCKAGGER
jgi:hypothetical protein